MPSAYDLYTFFLEPDHLRGRSVAVVVEQAIVEDVFNPRIKRDEPRIVLRFQGKKLALCCNKTQAAAMIEICGTDDFSKWVGQTVTLTPSRIDRERQTITITPAPTGNSSQQQTPALAAANADLDRRQEQTGGASEDGYDDEPREDEKDTGS